MKNRNKYLAFIVVLFSISVMVNYYTPVPIDWSLSCSKKDKKPYGCYVLFELITDLFPSKKITVSDVPTYNLFKNKTNSFQNYLVINKSYAPDQADVLKLLDWVSQGHQAFISASQLEGLLADTLKLKTSTDLELNLHALEMTTLNFLDPALRSSKGYSYKKEMADHYFTRFDTLKVKTLAVNDNKQIVFISSRFGAGTFYLCTVPKAFTNYNMLIANNAEFVFHALSYLPSEATNWDEYYKANKQAASTPLRYILSSEALSWAYYLLLFGCLCYVVFQGKRKQRAIPVIEPLKNTSMEYVTTIGRLYLQNGSNKKIAEKKVQFLIEYLRTDLNIVTKTFDVDFYALLSEKTQMEISDLKVLFNMIESIASLKNLDANKLLSLNMLIENFYNKNR